MTQVLLVGYDPETVDFSNPALPPDMTAEKIRAGVALALRQMTDRGWEGDVCYIRPDGTAGQTVERHLASANYACVVIGAGVRLPPQSLAVFEAVVNAIHKAAPAAAIAFNTRPEDTETEVLNLGRVAGRSRLYVRIHASGCRQAAGGGRMSKCILWWRTAASVLVL